MRGLARVAQDDGELGEGFLDPGAAAYQSPVVPQVQCRCQRRLIAGEGAGPQDLRYFYECATNIRASRGGTDSAWSQQKGLESRASMSVMQPSKASRTLDRMPAETMQEEP